MEIMAPQLFSFAMNMNGRILILPLILELERNTTHFFIVPYSST